MATEMKTKNKKVFLKICFVFESCLEEDVFWLLMLEHEDFQRIFESGTVQVRLRSWSNTLLINSVLLGPGLALDCKASDYKARNTPSYNSYHLLIIFSTTTGYRWLFIVMVGSLRYGSILWSQKGSKLLIRVHTQTAQKMSV